MKKLISMLAAGFLAVTLTAAPALAACPSGTCTQAGQNVRIFAVSPSGGLTLQQGSCNAQSFCTPNQTCPYAGNNSCQKVQGTNNTKTSCNNASCVKQNKNNCQNANSACKSTCPQVFGKKNANCNNLSCSTWMQRVLNLFCRKTKTCTPSCVTVSTPSASNVITSETAETLNASMLKKYRNEVVTRVNTQRKKNGQKPLLQSAKLNTIADEKAKDMADNNYFSHTSPTYGTTQDMLTKAKITFRTCGENIAMGQTTPESVMNAWMNSAGHKANILDADYNQIGVGVAQNAKGQIIWTQEFMG